MILNFSFPFPLLSVVIILLVGINISNCESSMKITIVASKYFLSWTDRSVLIECHGNSNVDANTSVIFTLGRTVIYNSTNNFIGSGVLRHNLTTIRYSRITSGVVDAVCQVGTIVSSNRLTLPYISQLTFTPEPENFTLNEPFLAKCTINLAPNITIYDVIFYFDDTAIGRWTIVKNFLPIFTRQNTFTHLDVKPGETVWSNFSAKMTPFTAAARGQYYCQLSIVVDAPFVFAYSDKSNIWNVKSGSLQGLPSILLMFFVIFVSTIFDLNMI